MYWKVTHTDGSAFHWIGPEHFRPPNDKAKRITKEAYERGKANEPRRVEGKMPRRNREPVASRSPRHENKQEAARLRREARKKRKEHE